MPETPLSELLERYRASRDDAAMAELVSRTRLRLWRVARRIVPADLAEDCVQLAYLSLVRDRGDDFRPQVLPWLYSATVRIAYATKARERKQRDLARRLEHVQDDAVERSDLARTVRARVESLPAKYRDAVVLHHLEGLSVREAASLLDASEEAVKKRLQRGRSLLQSRLSPRLLAPALLPFWLLRDVWAAVPRVGGILVKKKLGTIGVLLLLALSIAFTWPYLEDGADAPPPRRAARVEIADVAPEETRPTPEVSRTFSGRVLDADGRPVPGASVRHRGADEGTVTDDDGRFELVGDAEQSELIATHVPSRRAAYARFQAGTPRDLRLRPAFDRTGRVLNERDEPIAGATVVWRSADMGEIDEREATTDAHGAFSLPALGTVPVLGASWVEVRADGYAPGAFPEWQSVDVFVLTRGCFVEGTIRGVGDEPVAGAKVEFLVTDSVGDRMRSFLHKNPWRERVRGRAISDSEGRYRLGPVPARGYADAATERAQRNVPVGYVQAHAEGYKTERAGVLAQDPGTKIVRDVKLTQPRWFRGTVVDEDGQPVPRAKVGVGIREDGQMIDRRTAPDGSFAIPVQGRWRSASVLYLRVEAPYRYRSDATARAITGFDESPFRITLKLGRRPAIPFRVLDAQGRPIEGARITLDQDRFLNNAHHRVLTDADGRAILDDAGEGERKQHVYIEARGYAPNVVGPLDPFAKHEPIEVRLERGNTLRGQVVWLDGKPAARIFIELTTDAVPLAEALGNAHIDQPATKELPPLLHYGRVETDALGRFEARDLPAGGCWVFARSYLETENGHVALAAAGARANTNDRDVKLVLRERESDQLRNFRGTVVSEEGKKPLRAFSARLRRGSQSLLARVVGPGRFRFPPFEAGAWDLELDAPGFEPLRIEGYGAQMADRDHTARFELRRGIRIDGRLRGGEIKLEKLSVCFVRTDGTVSAPAQVAPDGRFSSTDLQPGRWFVRIQHKRFELYAPTTSPVVEIPDTVRALGVDYEIVRAAYLSVMAHDHNRDLAHIRITSEAGDLMFDVRGKKPPRRVPLPLGTYHWSAEDRDGNRGSGTITFTRRSGYILSIPKPKD